MVDLIVELSETVHTDIEALAREYGYVTVSDYVRALIEQTVEDEIDISEGFKQAWREIKTGDVIPIEEAWKLLDDE